MLINQKQEGEGGRTSRDGGPHGEGNSHEYQTANELYEMIAKSHPFDPEDTKSLTTQDLVILYKNIEIGTKLLSSNSYDLKSKTPNQYVESVVYNDNPDSDGSDVSEILSSEDLNNVFMINSERIDFFNSMPSYDNTLCQKFGNIDIKSSKLSAEYDKHFLFNDPFIKEQFMTLNNISKSKHSDSSVLPTSLLDYICCKRLEDNYNFYMDNIIQYVKHTIDQLKRISNGDYLTERVKEKWREVDNGRVNSDDYKSTVLSSSNSIPLHVEEKFNGNKSTWDDIVHSEMDIRSLSKILEKKIVVEVPKLLCGSFKLFSKRYKNGLFIRYKKDKHFKNEDKREESRVDVVLKLKRSGSGHVISNIDSIMILKTVPIPITTTEAPQKLLALQFNEIKNADEENESRLQIVELADDKDHSARVSETFDTKPNFMNHSPEDDNSESRESGVVRGENNIAASDSCSSERTEANFNFISPDELHCTMRRLNMQLPVLEEIEDGCTKRKKSPTKVRIKSPYENKSFIMEEKKRKKLLEIREKREKKKNTINESCKITKHKYGKGVIMPQPSSSVTKLSITNKSFYNSIYGQSLNSDTKTLKKSKGPKGDSLSTLDLQNGEEDVRKDTSLLTPERNSQKYINRSYYLDDAETEVMYMQMKKSSLTDEVKNASTSSTSPLSNETSHNIALFKQFIDQSVTDSSITDTSSSLQPNVTIDKCFLNTKNHDDISSNSNHFLVPMNTPKIENDDVESISDIPPTAKCRKSIEKVYDLIKAISKTDACSTEVEKKHSKATFGKLNNIGDIRAESSTIQASDSGTSIKHQLTSSNPSCYSFDKTTTDVNLKKNGLKKTEQPVSVIPKVIISSKTQTGKERDKNEKKNKKNQPEISKNPLKAISQLLHEFDHVQKTRHKNGHELKSNKKSESTSDGKAGSRQFSRKAVHQEQHLRSNGPALTKSFIPNERRTRHSPGRESVKLTLPHSAIEEKSVERGNKKKIADFIDEVKELNGEAVRGPPKRSSRLNSLAQPKKSYVQAHHEEYQSRYGKNLVSDRLHKLATAPGTVQERNVGAGNSRSKQRRGLEVLTGSTSKQVHSPGPCLGAKVRRSASSSPDGIERNSPVLVNGPSYNYSNVPETLEPLKKKMVAVETYVKSHFGHVSPALEQGDGQVRKSRVPLIPTDFDLSSLTSSPTADESTALGNKLHYIIDSMVSNLPALTALKECNESSSKLEKDEISIESSSKCDEIVSCSDYPVDVFEDKNIVTVVGSILNNKDDDIVEDECDANDHNYDKDKFCTDELEMLENALYNQLSNGNFQKRLRIKNLTLTPKQSVQQVFVLQSGDSRSMFLKSSLSQKLDVSKTEALTEIAMLPGLSKSHIGWEFTKFPLQIATVGYAFSEMQPVECSSTSRIKTIDDDNKSEIMKTYSKKNISFSKSTIQLHCSSENQINKRNIPSSVEDIAVFKNDIQTGINCRELDINNSLSVKEKPKYLLQENKDIMTKVEKNENADQVDYSTSLDILVGLLNEIKRITTCQDNNVNLENRLDLDLEKKELEIILNKAVDQEGSVDPSLKNIVSQVTLASLQHLGPNSSNYSLVSSNKSNIFMIDKQIVTSDINLPFFTKTLTVDKEINVNIIEKQWIHQCTEVTELYPIKINQSTKITDSLMTITTKPSSQSVDCFDDCQTVQTSSVRQINEQLRLFDSSKSDYLMTCPKRNLEDFKEENNVHKITECVTKKKQSKMKRKVLSQENKRIISELDPIIKMKRDILVTVYSILVFTMFAALSFPQFVY